MKSKAFFIFGILLSGSTRMDGCGFGEGLRGSNHRTAPEPLHGYAE